MTRLRAWLRREPVLAVELPRLLLFALALAAAIYGDYTPLAIVAAVFCLFASVLLATVARSVSLPILLPREPDPPLPGPSEPTPPDEKEAA